MSRWSHLKRELHNKALHGEKLDIVQENISHGLVHGTTYYKKGTNPQKGVLLVHGMSHNRYSMGVLAERLAEYGYFCLSIDLPSHFLNQNTFSLGEISETITAGVSLLKGHYGLSRAAVISHSIGAIGALFSSAGYTKKFEQEIYHTWNHLRSLIHTEARLLQQRTSQAKEFTQEFNEYYTRLKKLILHSLKEGIVSNSHVTAYVFLSPPMNLQRALPGLRLLKGVSHKWVKRILESVLHKPAVRKMKKTGNLIGFDNKNDPDYMYWQFFKTNESGDFLDYILHAKEPKDFFTLIEELSQFRHRDQKTNFLEYYQKKYLKASPKLFVYGYLDSLLRPFTRGYRKRLEGFYKSCGNAEVHHGAYNHILTNNRLEQFDPLTVKNDKVTRIIFNFLDKNV